MNNEIFQHARSAYASKNYEAALAAYTQCLQDVSHPLAPGEMGLLYHQIGNCLVKLDDYNEAIHAYTQATADSVYDAVGAVNYNLGMAYAALHDYEDAVRHFEISVSDAKYDTPYKAYAAMGSALLKLGKSAEAGVAFRQAALDEGNPDPTKSLLNLGICFMALDRPSDAVTSYESALQFDMPPATRNKLFANLGQAYVACGQMQKAVSAFESALADKTYFLSDSANVDYQRAVGSVASGTSEMTAIMSPVSADMSGLDVPADGTPAYPVEDPYAYGNPQDAYYYNEPYGAEQMPGYAPDDRFFNASDEELEQWSKGLAKQDRKRRNVGLKILVFFIALILIALAAGVFLFTQGFGIPSQETVVEELFADPEAASSSVFAKDLSDEKIQSMLAAVEADPNATIDGVNKSMSESTAFVNAKTAEGGEVTYQISLVRDLIGWKVSNVELYFASQNQ
ncbi:tetratricopeptide repeat protein [Raoultibacter phocaeensis]|uniref:tetratricopeptide repeat protein n=1 Tax=Raoultibacter phocaeensis TaxID=2479841 RepID=UPI00111BC01D|nr:tetratricopeptide repeat protein [Raoultibacter phocaeensis]